MRLLILLPLLLCGCLPDQEERPLVYMNKLQRAEALYEQNDKTLETLDSVNAKADELAEDIRDLYRLVVELRYRSSPSCSCSTDTE